MSVAVIILYVGKILVNLANRMPFANVLPASYLLLLSVVAIHVAYSPIFTLQFFQISLFAKFSYPKIFPRMVYPIIK